MPPTTRNRISMPAGPSGRKGPASRGRGAATSSGTLTRAPPTNSQTVAVLQRGVRSNTEKGRQVSEAIDNMYDMYYDIEQNADFNNGHTQDLQMLARQQKKAGGTGGMPLTQTSAGSSFCFLPKLSERLGGSLAQGPLDEHGKIFDASDTNLLCMDVLRNSAVVGSCDHGLIVFDTQRMAKRKTLYTKQFGHSEWVTDVKYLNDGRIISAGMDSKLCLWHNSAVRCNDLLGHTGSVAMVLVNNGPNAANPNSNPMAISAAYDRTIRIWDLNSCSEVGLLAGHKDPVMQIAWYGNMLISGDRRCGVRIWDLETTSPVLTLTDAGKGQIGSLCQIPMDNTMDPNRNWTVVGDQGGKVSIYDFRDVNPKVPLFSSVLHPGGVVSDVKPIMQPNGVPLIVTAGADKRMLVLEPRKSFEPLYEIKDHKDFIYSLTTCGNLIFSGSGNGWLLVHDINNGAKCCYGLGANKGAVRCIHVDPQINQVVCAGDDGKAVVYNYLG